MDVFFRIYDKKKDLDTRKPIDKIPEDWDE